MKKFQGNGCAKGCAVGKAVVKKEKQPAFSDFSEEIRWDAVEDTEEEVVLLEECVKKLDEQLEALYEKTLEESGEEAAELMESYQMILCDRHFFAGVKEKIRQEKVSCVSAILHTCDCCRREFEAMEDTYMKERYQDIQTVCQELVKLAKQAEGELEEIRLIEPTIVVADTLTPVDTVKLDKQYLKGFVTETGGATSHAVILARTLGIPAIVGVKGITELVENGMELIIDGTEGTIVLDADDEEKERFERKIKAQMEADARYAQEVSGEVYTKDKRHIKLEVNSGDSDTAESLNPDICDGVGLFRTEFQYMKQNDYPDEETLFGAYRDVTERMKDKEVVFRTLDIGGDKALEYMKLPEEENPFLGYRAVRICLDRPEIFRIQLRAILRASAFGNVKIMFPMITGAEELLACRRVLEECRQELREENIPFKEDVKVGIMVETPSAVMVLDQLARYSDFFSVGTNDLVQYIMAADRGNANVQKLYDPYQPSVLRALHHIGHTAQKYGIPVSVCGETAAILPMVPFLIGCGVEKLSAAVSSLPQLRYLVRRLEWADCVRTAAQVICMESVQEIKNTLRGYVDGNMEGSL